VFSSRAHLAILVSAACLAAPVLAATTHHAGSHSSTKAHSASTRATTSSHTATGSHVATTAHVSTGSHGAVASHRRGTRAAAPASHKLHGQQSIDPERVTAIQQALVREHYLTEANGKWDSTTEAAMQKYQADQGWQTKLMPDSRALKMLGLGPDYSNAINAKDANFAEPSAPGTISPDQSAAFAAAAGISR
jgi:hypothetical protein